MNPEADSMSQPAVIFSAEISRSQSPADAGGLSWRLALGRLRSGITVGRLVSGLPVLSFSSALTFGIYLYWDLLVAMGPWGYAGVFVSELVSSAAILIPVPAHNYAMAMAINLDPYLLGLAGGIGAGLGEVTGYLLGRAGKGAVSGGRWFVRFQSMAKRRLGLAILIFAFMPAPIDFVGMLAGAAGYPAWRFVGIACLGKTLKITMITVAASYGLPLIIDYLS